MEIFELYSGQFEIEKVYFNSGLKTENIYMRFSQNSVFDICMCCEK